MCPAPKGNKFALGNSGKPPIFQSIDDLMKAVNGYFEYCSENTEKATITGLALYLGFCTRKSLDDYEDRGDEYLYIIKRAKLAVEHSYEMAGQTIDIFALKNMGWKDSQEIDHLNNGNSFDNLSDDELIKVAKRIVNPKTKK
jgi:hypothetical protein